MRRGFLPRTLSLITLSALVLVAGHDVRAHGGGNWDPFTISVVNDRAQKHVVATQVLVAEIVRGRAGKDEWPLESHQKTRDELITAKEEVDEILEHYVNDGISVQLPATWHAEPQAGRTAAASGALGAAIALLEHAATLASAEDFVAEVYAGGLAARLFELLEAHGDRMTVYGMLAAAGE